MLLLFFILIITSTLVIIVLFNKSTNASRRNFTQVDIRNQIINMISDTFYEIGWSKWYRGIHSSNEQFLRLEKASTSKNMKLIDYNKETGVATILGDSGKNYTVCCDECSCKDFLFRRLPCKHMYFLAIIIEEKKLNSK